jgi:hypothetical protein
MVVLPESTYRLKCICNLRFTLVYSNLMYTTLSHLVFVQIQCRIYSTMGMRSGRLVLLCPTDGGLHTCSIKPRGSALKIMRTVGYLNLTWPVLPPWSPSTGSPTAAPCPATLRPRQRRRSARGYASSHKGSNCYGALVMCMIGCAGLQTPSKIGMYHTLVFAPAFLASLK